MFVTEHAAEKLRAAVQSFEERPKHLDMSTWYAKSDYAPCGMVACLAGEIAVQSKNFRPRGSHRYDDQFVLISARCDTEEVFTARAVASAELGIQEGYDNPATRLFYLDAWPVFFQRAFCDAEPDSPERIQALRYRVEHFIHTGE